ncbi:MAG: hypothetical protein JO359_05425 [Candidatus Eremiobacteraeota bacterium]|nr:hypothetical protein [Candidatus Eremiobacteraeota bacterium]
MLVLAIARAGVGSPLPAAPDAPEAVLRASSFYAAQTRGLIGMQRHFATTIDAGVVKHSEDSESGLLLKDGAFLKAKYYRVADDGKSFSPKQIADRDAQTNEGWSAGKIFFKEPYDPRYIGDYAFAVKSCDCREGTVEIGFTSTLHDAQHGAGSMWIDNASGRVEKLTYVPYVLPPHASSGQVTETSSQALADLWYVTRIDEVYQGRAFLLRGTGTFVATFDHFERFANVAEAEKALADGIGGTVVTR